MLTCAAAGADDGALLFLDTLARSFVSRALWVLSLVSSPQEGGGGSLLAEHYELMRRRSFRASGHAWGLFFFLVPLDAACVMPIC